MSEPLAPAHCRPHHCYSGFHAALTQAHGTEAFALRHLYNSENVRYLLVKKQLIGEELAQSYFHGSLESDTETIADVVMQSIIIDVWQRQVWVRLPAWLPVTPAEEQVWLLLNPRIYRDRDGVKTRKNPYGLCRLFSKNELIEALIEQNSTPSQGAITYNNNLSYSYSDSENSILELEENGIFCSCCSYGSLQQAFQEDAYMANRLRSHPVLMGQLPDRHVFAAWRDLNVEDFSQYQFEYCKLVLRLYGLSVNTKFNRYGNSHLTVYLGDRQIGQIWKRRGEDGRAYWRNEVTDSEGQILPGDDKTYCNFAEAAIAAFELWQQAIVAT